MIGDSLTFKNLTEIKKSMDKIKPIDQSDLFKSYYKEVIERLITEGKKRDILCKQN